MGGSSASRLVVIGDVMGWYPSLPCPSIKVGGWVWHPAAA